MCYALFMISNSICQQSGKQNTTFARTVVLFGTSFNEQALLVGREKPSMERYSSRVTAGGQVVMCKVGLPTPNNASICVASRQSPSGGNYMQSFVNSYYD